MSRRSGSGGGGGAKHLAHIHGTEEDRVNCSFFSKIGFCRHGDKCSRRHNRPRFSQTIQIPHLWSNPSNSELKSSSETLEEFNQFYYELFVEFAKYGKIEDLYVVENQGAHLLGNVFVKYDDEEEAEKALEATNGRYFAGKKLLCEYSPVTDFKEARCRQYDESTCTSHGTTCNFLHLKNPSKECMRYIQREFKKDRGRDDRRRSRSNDRKRSDIRDRSRSRSRDRDRRRDRSSRDRKRSRSRSKDRDRSVRDRTDDKRGGERSSRDDMDRSDRSRSDRSRSDTDKEKSEGESTKEISQDHATDKAGTSSDN